MNVDCLLLITLFFPNEGMDGGDRGSARGERESEAGHESFCGHVCATVRLGRESFGVLIYITRMYLCVMRRGST